jgi:VWFA-related protein
MKNSLLALFLVTIFALQAVAQETAPTPPRDEAVVKISTNLIQIDVTVTDKGGKVVTGLRAEDFEVFENGERQNISTFSFKARSVGGVSIGDASKPETKTGQSANGPLNPAAIRRSVAIVVDDLNLSFGSIYYTRKALKKFVDEQMQPDDLVAIIRTGGGVGALQQFTSDKRLLHAAIAKIRWNPLGGSFDALASVGQNDVEITDRFTRESDLVASGQSKTTTSILIHDNISDKKATDYAGTKNAAAQEEGIYTQTSLGTVRYIISGMNKLPGRKAMMLFSDGMAIGNESNKSRSSSVFNYLQDVADLANRSSVVVYTFDTKGMRSMSIGASDNTYEVIDGHRGQKERERTRDFKDSQDGLVYFASQTGGKALLNSDDLNGGIQRALDEQAGYYLLGYVPDAETFDPNKRKFNKLEVKVTQPGLKVSHRSGFFNNNGTGTQPQPQLTAERQMAEALMSPFAQSDIALNINALYADDPVDGGYIRSFLHIDARNLSFTDTAEGWKTSTFDVAAVTFGDNGKPVENIESKYTIKTKGATYDAMLKNGFVYVLIMPVKKPGLYQYRVALRDIGSGKIGSAAQVVDVPNLAKQKLTVSSLAVEDVSMSTWQNITQGKVGNNAGQIKVASTLLYDTVLKLFPAGTVLRYGFEVYNAKIGKDLLPQIETQAKILQNDKVIVAGNPIKLDAKGQRSPDHLQVSGAILLNDKLPEGDYVLQIIAKDNASNQVSTQLFSFSIVK